VLKGEAGNKGTAQGKAIAHGAKCTKAKEIQIGRGGREETEEKIKQTPKRGGEAKTSEAKKSEKEGTKQKRQRVRKKRT